MQEGSRLPHLSGRYYAQEPVQETPNQLLKAHPAQFTQPNLQQPNQLPNQSVQQPQQYQQSQQPQQDQARQNQRYSPWPSDRFDTYLGDYTPVTGSQPPHILSQFTSQPSAICNPRFLRPSTSNIHPDGSIQRNLGIPLTCLWQPLAELDETEDQPPIVERAPFRCTRCLAYANPSFQFAWAQNKVICNICGMALDVPEDYQAGVSDCAELNNGCYEFVAPQEYYTDKSHIPIYMFCIEASVEMCQAGIVSQVISSIMGIVDTLQYPEFTRVGVMLFNNTMQFHRITPTGDIAEVVVGDLADGFCPDPYDKITFNIQEQRDALDLLLQKVLDFKLPQNPNRNVMSLQTIVGALKDVFENSGARLMFFMSQLGTVGDYPLTMRDDPKLYNTDKEKNLFQPANTDYTDIAEDLTNSGITVDIFAFPKSYIDIATLSLYTTKTGGDFHYFPKFDINTDSQELHYTLYRILTRAQGVQVIMRARCSQGLGVETYAGNFMVRPTNDLSVAGIDSDKSILIYLKYEDKLQPNQICHIQCAMLYTSFEGVRYIRVFNTQILANSNLGIVYRSCDAEVIACSFLRISITQLLKQKLNIIRENLTKALLKILESYKIGSGQRQTDNFSVPESLKLLPVYINAANKLPVLSLNRVSADLRMYSYSSLLSMCPGPLIQMLYPKVYRIDNLLEQSNQPGVENETGVISLPELTRCSVQFISKESAYLIDNGKSLFIIIGENVSNEFLYSAFGCNNYDELLRLPQPIQFEEYDTEESIRLSTIIQEIQRRSFVGFKSLTVTLGTGPENFILRALMMEDTTPSEMSYSQYVLNIHRVIMEKMRSQLIKNE